MLRADTVSCVRDKGEFNPHSNSSSQSICIFVPVPWASTSIGCHKEGPDVTCTHNRLHYWKRTLHLESLKFLSWALSMHAFFSRGRYYLYLLRLWANLHAVPERDTTSTSVFQDSSFYTRSCKDNLEQWALNVWLARFAEMQDTHRELFRNRNTQEKEEIRMTSGSVAWTAGEEIVGTGGEVWFHVCIKAEMVKSMTEKNLQYHNHMWQTVNL